MRFTRVVALVLVGHTLSADANGAAWVYTPTDARINTASTVGTVGVPFAHDQAMNALNQ